MRRFLIRLFNLEPPPEKVCQSCAVFERWIEQLNADNEILRRQLEQNARQSVEDRNLEREDRKELEDVVLKFVRIKSNGQQPSIVPPQPIDRGAERQPLRPGTSWGRIKAQLEEDSRKVMESYKRREEKEIQAGKLKEPNAS